MGSELPALAPFQQMPFEQLPQLPRRPHPYFDEDLRDAELTYGPYGPHRVTWRQHGSGPPLLLVHGLMTSSYSWRYVLEPLGERFTVYAPDLPGAGCSDKLAGPYHPEVLAGWIGAFAEHVGIRGCATIGNSMGGYLCMRLALRDPEAMSRLLNLHSPGRPELRLHALRFALSVPGVKAALGWWVRRDPLRWAHRNVHYFDESLKSLEEATEYGLPLADRPGSRAFIGHLHQTMAPGPLGDFLKQLKQRDGFPIPLMLLYAPADPMVSPEVGKVLSVATGVDVTWLERGSHFAHVDATDEFLSAALPFLE